MREGWEYKKLGDVASYINGYAFKPKQWKEHGTPIIRIQNLNNPKAPFNYFDGEVPEKVKVQDGDLLISWFLNQHIFKVVFDKTDIDKLFLKYAVASKLEEMVGQVHGATMKHIVKKDFDNTRIPVPPKSTQLAIVSELDKINEIIDLKKTQLKDLDLLAQSIFYDMFGDPIENPKGWEVKKLGEVCTKISDGVHAKPEYTETGMPFISVVNINKRKLSFEDCKYVSIEAGNTINKRCKPQFDDILYTKVGATYGIPALVDTTRDFCLYVSVCLIKPIRDIINSVFLCQMMGTPYIKFQADRSIKGIGVPDLHLNQIKDFNIILPPLSLQQSFAEKMQAIESQKSAIKQSLTEVETLLASRMDYYFN